MFLRVSGLVLRRMSHRQPAGGGVRALPRRTGRADLVDTFALSRELGEGCCSVLIILQTAEGLTFWLLLIFLRTED